MKIAFTIAILFCSIVTTNAQNLTGLVTDSTKKPLGFSSIIVKGTSIGTSANRDGVYTLPLSAGTYDIICQHVGFKSLEKKVTIANRNVQLNFELKEQQYQLGAVSVRNGRNPAIEIMRNAIRKRPDYEKELKRFTTQVYIKGQLQVRSYPKRILGSKVNMGDDDTSQHKMLFLSETVANYSVDEPNRKVEVISTRVSGQSDAFGFSSPQIVSFYNENIKLGEDLNPRGFISPISKNAFNYYNYKFEGTFFDNGKMINRIRITPKRRYEPLFNGFMNIMENEWRIHSLQLNVLKENQMQYVDTLVLEQIYVPLKDVWVIKQQNIYPSINILGIDAYGSFVQVYDKFDVNPTFTKKFFDNTVLKVYDSANRKPTTYWDTVRPVPLLEEEVVDYIKKDSMEQVRKSPAYLDSVDRRRNRIQPISLLVSGQTFYNQKKKTTVRIEDLFEIFSYNTVEGVAINFKPVYTKRFSDTKRDRLTIIPGLRYGVTNKRFNPNLSVGYTYGDRYPTSFTISGGRDVFQFNRENPVRIFGNTQRTLAGEQNFLKIYEAGFGRLDFSKGLGAGFTASTYFEYQDRISLSNTTLHTWKDYPDRQFTPNIMIPDHQAAVVSFGIGWQPGAKYIELPDQRINIGSGYPTFNVRLTQGIKGVIGSEVDYTKWSASVNDEVNMNIAGAFAYRVTTGGFLNRRSVFFPDYTHYIGNLGLSAAPYLRSFQLMPFYDYSNVENFYTTAHVEYHLNGLLTNKIPLFKKLNWFLVTGSNFLYLPHRDNYTEVFVGLENILKIGRLDFVKSFTKNSNGFKTTGFRYTITGISDR